jgi:hypothetical protein
MKRMGIFGSGVTASREGARSSLAGLDLLFDDRDLWFWRCTDTVAGVAPGAGEVKVFAVDLVNEQRIRPEMAVAEAPSVAAQGGLETRG